MQIKKNIPLVFVIVSALGLVFLSSHTTTDTNNHECHNRNTSFKNGELLRYKVYYQINLIWIPAGETTLQLSESEKYYEIEVKGRSYSAYDNFFRVRDYFYSKIDKKEMKPVEFVRIISEGNYTKFDSIYFDYQHGAAKCINGKTKKEAVTSYKPIETCLHDLLSVMYMLRNVNVNSYKTGDRIDTKLLLDKEVIPIGAIFGGKEKNKKIKGLGKLSTLKIEPDLVAGEVFKKADKMIIWVSDDQNKIPLLIETPVKVGNVKAVLTDWKNLRNKSVLD
jgi:hypothetical protein